MKKVNAVVGFILLLLFIVACNNTTEKDLNAEIKSLEDSLFSDASKMINRDQAMQLISKYIEFTDTYPNDAEAPANLFKAADMSMNMNMPQKAIQLFDQIMETYPNFEKAPQCLFLKGYIFENDVNDLVKAKEIYEDFLVKYPNDEFADDAEISIKNLGKSPEELIKEFEEQARLRDSL